MLGRINAPTWAFPDAPKEQEEEVLTSTLYSWGFSVVTTKSIHSHLFPP